MNDQDREVQRLNDRIKAHIGAQGVEWYVLIFSFALFACMAVGLLAGAVLGFLYVTAVGT